ncbi:MAG: TIGR02186 family protein [Bradyrhizobium sp.]|nr:TIGR02186 family protein [Bradyrhizobium sp.]
MTARMALATLAVVLASSAGLAVRAAHAERLIVSVSNQRVTVTPNYSGEELVLFGSVENDAPTPATRTGEYDLVVTVKGPPADMVTRRKERRFGIWLNTDYRQFLKVPTYLALFSNRPFDAIASPEVQRRQQLGLKNVLLTQRVGPDYADVVPNDAFRSAFVRLRSEHGLYREQTSAVTFLTPTLFRTGIPLPANVPIGTYDVEIKLFSAGALITQTETTFDIVKVGFEQFVATTARQDGLLYGLVTAFMALMTGWMASIVFRKD